MCGIIAYIGEKKAAPLLIEGLEHLEYRGYDSAGLALRKGEEIALIKKTGKVKQLSDALGKKNHSETIGIAHTRWATHGEPNRQNTHPHVSHKGDFFMVHNGIIENYREIKQELAAKGVEFQSETDTEVFLNLIESLYYEKQLKIEEAMIEAIKRVEGSFAIVLMARTKPSHLYAAHKGSPLVIGRSPHGGFIASDPHCLNNDVEQINFPAEEGIAVLSSADPPVFVCDQEKSRELEFERLSLRHKRVGKGKYPHFMLKEIYEQPNALIDTMRGRIKSGEGLVKLGGIENEARRLLRARRLIIIACGTAWHAGLLGKFLLEKLAGLPAEVDYASEFRYRPPLISSGDVVIAISQSGETADTLAAVKLAKEKGALTLGICNVIGSNLSRITDAGLFTYAGTEVGVASTKAFTTQIIALLELSLWLAQEQHKDIRPILQAMENLPGQIETLLHTEEQIKAAAKQYSACSDFFFIGRGPCYPIALEGALKLKEISYIHAEGYPAGEMKHGPLALIDKQTPVVAITPETDEYTKTISNIKEVKTRGASLIAIASAGDRQIQEIAETVIEIPKTDALLTPILSIVPLQLLSYHIALLRGCDVDQPRNLAKSVTVE